MKHLRLRLFTIAAVATGWSATAEAQMFAPRVNNQATSGTFPGGPGSPTTGNGTASKGAINANSRFVRTGRDPNDFVGTDSGDRRRFVGARQAGGRLQRTPLLTALRAEPNANQAAPVAESNSSTSMYPPRLALDSELTMTPSVEVESVLQRRLERSRAIRWTGPLEVSVEGRTAILRGTVGSTKERALAALLAELEPGVSNVQNDLQVIPAPPPEPNEPPAIPE